MSYMIINYFLIIYIIDILCNGTEYPIFYFFYPVLGAVKIFPVSLIQAINLKSDEVFQFFEQFEF
jgi:hypothetical protein